MDGSELHFLLVRYTVAAVRRYIQKFPDCAYNEIKNNNNKHSSRSNAKGYGIKTH
jgi:hypothetical protein